jgi:hypothetical protein
VEPTARASAGLVAGELVVDGVLVVGDAKVGQDGPIAVEQDVSGLDVPVDDGTVAVVEVGQCQGDRRPDQQDLIDFGLVAGKEDEEGAMVVVSARTAVSPRKGR